jgi:hypothetical protein
MVLDAALQVWIFTSSAAAIWLLNDERVKRRRLGCWIGLCGQPAWVWTTLEAGQYGIFALALWFAASYARGLKRHGS